MSITKYIFDNLNQVSHPFNTSRGMVLADLKALCALLENFLNLPNYQNIGEQITTAIEDHQSLVFSDITRRISILRNLVLTVEPFIKAIGRLRYANDPELLKKVEEQKFRFLLEHGLILARMYWDENYSNKKHCSNYWSQQDCIAAVCYRVYLLRNEFSHETINYSAEKIFTLFNTTLSLILLVIRHTSNRIVLELETSPYRSYIEWVSENLDTEYEKYVSLQGYLKWIPSSSDEQILIPMLTDRLCTNTLPQEVDEVFTIIKQVDKMVLVGEGGAGKSRTLRHSASTLAKEILSLKLPPDQIPIYFPADILTNRDKILNLFSRLLPTIDIDEIQNGLEHGRYWLFIDGLNEIAPQRYLETIQELKAFLISYPLCRIVVATRQEYYHNELLLPVYELQKLTPVGVRKILLLNSENQEQGNQLFNNLQKDKHLLALFKTPLMSKLLCELQGKVYIPRSIGEMMKIIFFQVFEREERKGDRIPQRIKNIALTKLARKIRHESEIGISEEKILQIFRSTTQDFSCEISPNLLLTKLIESGILEKRTDELIVFFHEIALDYFFALGLKSIWDDNHSKELLEEIDSLNVTTIQILSGLVTDHEELIDYIAQKDLYLAAKCYSVRTKRSNKIFSKLLEHACSLIKTNSVKEESLGVEIMAALDEIEATQTVFKVLPQISEESRKVASIALIRYAPNGIVEVVNNALNFGDFEQKLVAIQFVAAHQLVEVAQTLTVLAEQNQVNLADDLAQALGRLETHETIAYLESKFEVPVSVRSFPLYKAINATISDASVSLLKKALFDVEIKLRQVAISRIEAIGIPELHSDIAELLKTESDFLVKLIGSKILLNRAGEREREKIIKTVFSSFIPDNYSFPAGKIMAVLSLLQANEIEDVSLQALCQGNKALQSLVINRAFSRKPELALSFVDLIDFQDPKIAPGVKSALIKALIQTNSITTEMLKKSISPIAPVGVRVAVAQTLESLPEEDFEPTVKCMVNDPSANVQTEVFKILCASPRKIPDSVIFPLLSESDQSLKRWVWRLINKKKLLDDKGLLNLSKHHCSNYTRRRAIQELCDRGFQWSLKEVCSLIRESDYGIQWSGRNILAAILRDRGEYPGQVIYYKFTHKYGFIIQLDIKKKLFFRLSAEDCKQYAPRTKDIVAFKISINDLNEEYAKDIRFLG